MKLRYYVGEYDNPNNEDGKRHTLNILLNRPIASDKR